MNTKLVVVKFSRGKHPRSDGISIPYYSMNEDYNSLQLYENTRNIYISFTVTLN